MQVGGKPVGRGTLKGLSSVAKRSRSGREKMKIQFSSKLGGPCGENRRTFVDDIVVNTRVKAPLIGVRYWSDVHPVVKNEIVEAVMVSHCPPHAPC